MTSQRQVLRDIAYVPHGHPRQTLDLYLPVAPASARDPRPLIIWIHGGTFRQGSRRTKSH